jgi:hypothetical protein
MSITTVSAVRKTRIESRRGDRAAQEDRRADQQQRRREDLHADQRVARAAGPRVLHQLAAQRPHRLDARRLQRGHQREERRGATAATTRNTATRQSAAGTMSRLTSPRSTGMVRSAQ